MERPWKYLAAAILAASVMGPGVSPAAAVQNFTDEAGQLLYTIDDSGIVSMFENSPGTDVTLSVTRGTREQMQPKVTEVIPEAVPAGSLPYVGKPKELDVPIQVPLDLSPGEVTIEVTTPIGRTIARFKTTEVQLGGSGTRPDVITHPGMGYGADEGTRSIPTTAPVSCPAGMMGVPSEGGGFCIEPDRTFIGSFRKAEQTCAQADRRLCRLFELRAACELAQAGRLPLKNMIGEWEWTSTFEILVDYSTYTEGAGDVRYFLLGKADCQTKHAAFETDARTYAGRCCK
ncbi:MAG: hypothetical protein E6K59_01995 [Nitrospirae bacterium]|nr:MAG: hypothetical protein E6K59_01995 [Nitrospirota bacterium]